MKDMKEKNNQEKNNQEKNNQQKNNQKKKENNYQNNWFYYFGISESLTEKLFYIRKGDV